MTAVQGHKDCAHERLRPGKVTRIVQSEPGFVLVNKDYRGNQYIGGFGSGKAPVQPSIPHIYGDFPAPVPCPVSGREPGPSCQLAAVQGHKDCAQNPRGPSRVTKNVQSELGQMLVEKIFAVNPMSQVPRLIQAFMEARFLHNPCDLS